MDPLLAGALAIAVLALAVTARLAAARGRTLEGLRVTTGAGSWGDIDARYRAAVEATRVARWEAGQSAADTAYLADLVGVGVIRLSDTLDIDFANRSAHTLLKRSPGSIEGRPAFEAFVEPRLERVVEAARDDGAGAAELTLRSADGPTLVARARRAPAGGIWLVLEDVSELRRLQRIRTEFIDNLSHELRTPLTSISILAETAAREAEHAAPKLRDRIAKIEVETGHLVQMVSELMDLSRMETEGGAKLLLDNLDLTRLAATSIERLRMFAERQGVRLVLEPGQPVPPVRGDEERLAQVLINLLHNAVKFSPNGGDVVVAVRSEGGEVILTVTDPGIGISRSDLGRIFERFYKADRARVRGRGAGTGLGLAIARHIVNAHGGRIWAESEEGHGATFSVALPVAPAGDPPPPAATPWPEAEQDEATIAGVLEGARDR